MLTCPKCNFANELGRIFCHSCGTKLDLTQIKGPGAGVGKAAGREPISIGRVLLRGLEIAVLLAIVWCIYLAAQVPRMPAITTTSEDMTAANRKWIALGRHIDQRQPTDIVVSEIELNAFIDTLGFEREGLGMFRLLPVDLHIELGDGVMRIVVLAELQVGDTIKKKVLLSCTGTPSVQNHEFAFKPVAASVGALPIHPRILQHTRIFQNYFTELFHNLAEERKILDQLASISVGSRRVQLSYLPPASAR